MKIDSPTFLSETTFISASVQFSSGSQKFGDTSDDLHQFTGSADFTKLAIAFKRIKNIAKELKPDRFLEEERLYPDLSKELKESAELALLQELDRRGPLLEEGLNSGKNYYKTFSEAAAFGPAVDLFFKEVLVMTDNERLRIARLRLVTRLQNLILRLADISEIVPEQ